MAASYGNSVFSFLRNFHTVLHSDRLNSHSHQRCRRAPKRDFWIFTNPARLCETKHISIQMCNSVCRLNGTVFNYLTCSVIIGSSLTWGQIQVEHNSQVWTRQVWPSSGMTGVGVASQGSWVWRRWGAPGQSLWRWGEGPASALAFGGLDHVGGLLRRRNLLGVITIACISISEKHWNYFSRLHCWTLCIHSFIESMTMYACTPGSRLFLVPGFWGGRENAVESLWNPREWLFLSRVISVNLLFK